MNLDPKARFLKDKKAVDFLAAAAASEDFHKALEAALCKMEMEMPPVVNPAQDVTTASQMNGAKKFIGILINLSEASKPVERKDPLALNP